MKQQIINHKRRKLLLGLGSLSLTVPSMAFSQNFAAINAADLGLKANDSEDQSELMQQLVDQASILGKPLFIPAGTYFISGINLLSNVTIIGLYGATKLVANNNDVLFYANNKQNILLKNLVLDGANLFAQNIIQAEQCENIILENLQIKNSQANAIYIEQSSGKIASSIIANIKLAAIHLQNSKKMLVTENKIDDCKNGGILVWRDKNAPDKTIVTNNQISNIGSESGSGQNGNGINAYLADEMIISNNNITDCAFSAIRVNSTNNVIIDNNICKNCQEVAIFSEFAFSGSIISNNIIDQTATGISVTNFDYNGRLAVVSGNIIRNVWQYSPTNPDTRPVGIFVEADCAVHSNLVENVPGAGIAVGWGPYLRNVLAAQNIIRDIKIGIAISIVEGVGKTKISDNLIDNAKLNAISGLAWEEIIEPNLIKNANKYPNHIISGNVVTN